MAKKRARHTAAKKMEILQKLLKDKRPMSEVCQEYRVQPSQVYAWQNELFSRGLEVFQSKQPTAKKDESETKIKALEDKLAKRESVLVELMQEHCELKKSLGEI